MRLLLVLTLGLGTLGLVNSQPPPPKEMNLPVRFGFPYREKNFPQATPKQTLESVVVSIERADIAYLVSNLMDPTFVDSRLAERARQLEPVIEAELVQLRQAQQANINNITPDARIPLDPVKVRAMAAERAKDRAFRQLVTDVQAKLLEDPETLKELRRFSRQGTFPADGGGMTARVGLADVKERAVFLKKIGDRWFIENRQVDEARPPEEKKPEEKKPEEKKN